MHNSTTQTYTSLTTAYDFFNRELYANTLPPCLITMQRHAGTYGYFSGERFAKKTNPKEITDEIALNPMHFSHRNPQEILSTLVHEMVHLWQHHHGKSSPYGYHNREWARKMHDVGLIPSATGEPGGKETGQKMTHLIEANGRFTQAVTKLLAEHPTTLYHDRVSETDAGRKKKTASKTKYTCPGCGQNAWAKPAASLICGNCLMQLQAQPTPDKEAM